MRTSIYTNRTAFFCITSMDDPLLNCRLRINDATRCSTNGYIIGKHNKFDVQHGTLPNSTDRDTCTILVIPIQARLRTVRLFVHEYGMHRIGRASRRIGGIRNKRLAHLLWARRWPPSKPYRHGHHMPIDDRHPITGRRHAQGLTCPHVKRLEAIVPIDQASENLERLPFHFFLLRRQCRARRCR